jgi:ribose 5-phosphate isomerase A
VERRVGIEQQKQRVGERAAELVEDGSIVGLGSGSTALEFVRALGRRVQDGLNIRAVASSWQTARAAEDQGIRLIDLTGPLDIVVDGADAIERGTLHAIKGLGGSLMREKLVAEASERLVLIADHRKIVGTLSESQPGIPLPVEVVSFGWERTRDLLKRFGDPVLREVDGQPFVTDNSNLILDLFHADYSDVTALANEIKLLTGVVDHGFFLNMATEAIIAWEDRIEDFAVTTSHG